MNPDLKAHWDTRGSFKARMGRLEAKAANWPALGQKAGLDCEPIKAIHVHNPETALRIEQGQRAREHVPNPETASFIEEAHRTSSPVTEMEG